MSIEELHELVPTLGGARDPLERPCRLVASPVELVAAGTPSSPPAPSPSRGGPGPSGEPTQQHHPHRHDGEEGHHADHASTIACPGPAAEGGEMSDSIYRVTEVIGTSATSWEDAAKNAVETAAKTLRDLRVGEIVKFDVTIEDGKVTMYRARVNISFKYETG
jgi:hypothetical protein